MLFESLDYIEEVLGENSVLQFPAGKNMPIKVYTFTESNKNHMFQLFTEGVVVLSSKHENKTVYQSIKPLNKINDTTVDVVF